jgi:hypothetical protein
MMELTAVCCLKLIEGQDYSMVKFKLASKVLTACVITQRDYTDAALETRRPYCSGTIVKEHNSHGLCYDVRHEIDGTIGCYDPDELESIDN